MDDGRKGKTVNDKKKKKIYEQPLNKNGILVMNNILALNVGESPVLMMPVDIG